MIGEEYTAFLHARNPEVWIQNSSGVPVKWIVTRAYVNGVSAKRHLDTEGYSHTDTGFFPIAMLMTEEQAVRRQEEIAKRERTIEKVCVVCGAAFLTKDPRKACCSAKCTNERKRGENARKYRERMENEERPILTCPVCGKKFRQKHRERICSDECRAKKATEAGKKNQAAGQRLEKESEEILRGEHELAKKIKRGKVCSGCGVIFRAKGGEEYCKTCREKGATWGIE